MSSSIAVVLAVLTSIGQGDGSNRSEKLKGALCGRGEISIESGTKLGDDEGMGGVVTPSQRVDGVLVPSTRYQPLFWSARDGSCFCLPRLSNVKRFELEGKSDRLGVATWGLEQY
jgi:hypothetical protein